MITLTLTSYDWGGEVIVSIVAAGCPAASVSAPQDSDKDGLPDEWEKTQYFWPAVDPTDPTKGRAAEKKKYDHQSPKTEGVLNSVENDGASDQDLDALESPVHSGFGDGLSARDEYRGVTVMGKHRKISELTDDGPIGGSGGTLVKDAFIFAEKAGNDEIFRAENTTLKTLGIIWHKIKKEEMKLDPKNKNLAGKINFDGENDQNAIWLANDTIGDDFLGTSTSSVKDGKKVLVDVNELKKLKYSAETERKYLDHIVAHELAHKLGIDHPEPRKLTWSLVPAGPGFDAYFFGEPGKNKEVNKKVVLIWVPVDVHEEKRGLLEYMRPASVGGLNDDVEGLGEKLKEDEVLRHATTHVAWKIEVKLDGEADVTEALSLYSHSGFLNDHIPEPSKFQDKLSNEDKAKPDLTK